jgi:uncharacterized protein YxjI
LFRLGGDSGITDERDRLVLHVDGKVLSLRNRLVLRDPEGREVAQVQRKLVAVRQPTRSRSPDSRTAEGPQAPVHTVRGPVQDHVPGRDDLEMRGDLFDHEFSIQRGGQTVATVAKRWFSMRDTYPVGIAPARTTC